MFKPLNATTVWIIGLAGVSCFGALEFCSAKISVRARQLLFLLATASLWVLGPAFLVLLPSDLAWIVIVLLWIRAAYNAFLRNEGSKNASSEHNFTAVKIGLIVLLALFAGGHALSFMLRRARDEPYRKVLAQLEQMQWTTSSYSADYAAGSGGFVHNKVLLVYSLPGPLTDVPRFLWPPAARIASICKLLPKYSVSTHQDELPDALRATRAEEVGTLALLSEYSHSKSYYAEVYPGRTLSTPDPNVTGERRTVSVMLFDVSSGKVVGRRSFDSESAESVTVRPGAGTHFSADDPHADLPSYLSHLPRR